MKTLSYSVLAIVALYCLGCQNKAPIVPAEPYTDARSFIENLDLNGAVLIAKNDSDLLRSGFGKANQATGEPNTPTTKFRLASVSKTLTGMGIVQLKRDGLIRSFDQPLSDFDEDFPQGDRITIRHLLTHQSGIPDYLGALEPVARNGRYFSPKMIYGILAESVTEDGLDFAPGTKTAYSNANFLIAALLIQELAAMSYEAYITRHILDPLGMNATELGTDGIPEIGYAQGYHQGRKVSNHPMCLTFGAGGWTSTLEDMDKWCRAMLGEVWLSAEEKEDIFGGVVPREATAFGMAWFKSNIDGKNLYWHAGDIDGFSTLIGFAPSSCGILIALSNEQDDTASRRNAILETIVKEEL